MIIKSWRIEKDSVNDADIAWLSGCCNRLEVKQDSWTYDNLISHQTRKVITIEGLGKTILVETVSEEQESMLKLKYEGQLTLMSAIHSGTWAY